MPGSAAENDRPPAPARAPKVGRHGGGTAGHFRAGRTKPARTPSGTEDLATVRARAADALAELDRERRRNEAAAATAALDAQRRRRPAAPPAGAAPAVARAAQAAPPPPTPPTLEQRAQVYLRIGLDEASRQLGGPAHVIEGMSAMFMGLAQGVVVPGADATRPVVRVVYQDSQGRLIMLDQQRLRPGQPIPQGSPLGWVLGETAIWLHGEVRSRRASHRTGRGFASSRGTSPQTGAASSTDRTRRTSSSEANGFRMKATSRPLIPRWTTSSSVYPEI